MSRAILLVILVLSLTAWGQTPQSYRVVAFDSPDANLGAVGAVPAASTTVASINVSSRQTSAVPMQPALLSTSNPAGAQTAIISTTTNLPRRWEPSVKQKRIWWTLTAAQHGAATFDAWSTRKSISSGNGYERNPLMKPFANSAAIYPIIQVAPLGLDYVSKRMMGSRHSFFRKTWWVPQTLATAGFAWSGVHNMRVANGK